MGRTYRGESALKSCYRTVLQAPFRHRQTRMPRLEIEAIRGEVHRFEGTVDKLGCAPKSTGFVQTVCVKDLVHCRTGQALSLDHWWFRLHSEWMEAAVRPGDRVIFVAKVQRCSKGIGHPSDAQTSPGKKLRCQVVGFGSKVRSLVIKRYSSERGLKTCGNQYADTCSSLERSMTCLIAPLCAVSVDDSFTLEERTLHRCGGGTGVH